MGKLKPLDFLAFAFAGIITVGSFVYAYGGGHQSSHLIVQAAGDEWVYPLDTPAELEFEGPLGTTRVQIQDGGARVVSSPCRDKICILAGRLYEGGDWTACLPNRIFLKISGNENQPVDEITY